MINFHLPPIADSAAVNGHPPTGMIRDAEWLLSGAFLMELMGRIIVVFTNVTNQFIAKISGGLENDRRS
jgi:hypothetical protein